MRIDDRSARLQIRRGGVPLWISTISPDGTRIRRVVNQ
jgi:hypothetical protein